KSPNVLSSGPRVLLAGGAAPSGMIVNGNWPPTTCQRPPSHLTLTAVNAQVWADVPKPPWNSTPQDSTVAAAGVYDFIRHPSSQSPATFPGLLLGNGEPFG